jgi:hypothetical protein
MAEKGRRRVMGSYLMLCRPASREYQVSMPRELNTELMLCDCISVKFKSEWLGRRIMGTKEHDLVPGLHVTVEGRRDG